MPAPRRLLLAALLVAYAPAAWPQDAEDDLLAPLTPAEGKTKKKRKKAPPPAPPAPLVREKERVREEPAKLLVRLPDPSLRNARLYVDDKEAGVLPVEALDATPGEHKVTVKRLGYAPFNAMVRVKDSGVTELLAVMEPLAGVLSVASETVGVEVFVDGKSYGPVPVNDVVIAPGDHQLRFKRDGYDEQTQSLNVKAGRDYALRASLNPQVARTDRPEKAPRLEPRSAPPRAPAGSSAGAVAGVERGREEPTPWFGQWYVWAGGAAVAAGVAGGVAYVATRPQSPCGTGIQCDACINAPAEMRQFCNALTKLPMVGFGGPIGK